MRSTVSWSLETDAVIKALNRHRDFELNFQITGSPEHPLIQGFDDSLIEGLKKDFNKNALALIRHRTNEELQKFTDLLAA